MHTMLDNGVASNTHDVRIRLIPLQIHLFCMYCKCVILESFGL